MFRRLRNHAAARLSALGFVALILLPFTAPFPTYVLDVAHGQPIDAPLKECKTKLDADSGLISAAPHAAGVAALNDVLVRPVLRAILITGSPQHPVLRL